MPRVYIRVAVAQLACHPAIELSSRSPLEDPLFDMARLDSLLPEGEPPPELEAHFRELRERIAGTYCDQLLLKVKAILAQCQQWGGRVLVFLEAVCPILHRGRLLSGSETGTVAARISSRCDAVSARVSGAGSSMLSGASLSFQAPEL